MAEWIKWKPGKFLVGVRNLQPFEIAVYSIVLNLIYEHEGPVKNDPAFIASHCNIRRAPDAAKAIASLVAKEKLFVVDGFLSNARASKTLSELPAGRPSNPPDSLREPPTNPPHSNTQPPTFKTGKSNDFKESLARAPATDKSREDKTIAVGKNVADFQKAKDDLAFEKMNASLDTMAGVDQVFGTSPKRWVTGPIFDLSKQGYDLDRQIMPSLKAQFSKLIAKGRTVASWSYFVQGIIDDHSISGVGREPPLDPKWESLLRMARVYGMWDFKKYGPAPNQPDSKCPSSLVRPTDGQGWVQWNPHAERDPNLMEAFLTAEKKRGIS